MKISHNYFKSIQQEQVSVREKFYRADMSKLKNKSISRNEFSIKTQQHPFDGISIQKKELL